MFFLYVQQYYSYYILVEPAIVVVRQEVQVCTINQPYVQQAN